MRRAIFLPLLLATGVLSVAASGAWQQRARPGRPGGALVPIPDIQKIKDNLYIIPGGHFSIPGATADGGTNNGGNTAVFITDTGVVLVDTKYAGWGPTILEEVRTITSMPVTTIINTHTHNDHTGSNTEFPATVEFLVQENTKANMAKATCGPYVNCEAFQGENAKYLPKQTFKDTMSIGSGKDRIDLYYFGAGHTSGDAWVVFPALRAMHAGDMFVTKGLIGVNVDPDSGGSYAALPESLARAAVTIKNVDTVIPGHSAVSPWSDFKEYTEFVNDLMTLVKNGIGRGQSVDDIVRTSRLLEKYKDYGIEPDKLKSVVSLVSAELTR